MHPANEYGISSFACWYVLRISISSVFVGLLAVLSLVRSPFELQFGAYPFVNRITSACHSSCRSGFILSCKVVVSLSGELFAGGNSG